MRSISLNLQLLNRNSIVLLDRRDLKVSIKPSNRIYFDEYLYKATVDGAYIYHDIELHDEISMWICNNISTKWRHYWSNKGRSFYFQDFDSLKDFVTAWHDHVVQVRGPVSDNHLSVLLGETEDLLYQEELRDKLYYNKYHYKINFSRYHYTSDINTSNGNVFCDVDKLISAQTADYKWHEKPREQQRMYHNYLYLKEYDYEHVLTMLLLNYKQLVRDKHKVIVYKNLER